MHYLSHRIFAETTMNIWSWQLKKDILYPIKREFCDKVRSSSKNLLLLTYV